MLKPADPAFRESWCRPAPKAPRSSFPCAWGSTLHATHQPINTAPLLLAPSRFGVELASDPDGVERKCADEPDLEVVAQLRRVGVARTAGHFGDGELQLHAFEPREDPYRDVRSFGLVVGGRSV